METCDAVPILIPNPFSTGRTHGCFIYYFFLSFLIWVLDARPNNLVEIPKSEDRKYLYGIVSLEYSVHGLECRGAGYTGFFLFFRFWLNALVSKVLQSVVALLMTKKPSQTSCLNKMMVKTWITDVMSKHYYSVGLRFAIKLKNLFTTWKTKTNSQELDTYIMTSK